MKRYYKTIVVRQIQSDKMLHMHRNNNHVEDGRSIE